MKQKKLASSNVTALICLIGFVVMVVGAGVLNTSSPTQEFTATNWIFILIGLGILVFGVIRASAREHEP